MFSKNIFLLFLSLFLTGCSFIQNPSSFSYDQNSYTYAAVDKESPLSEGIDFTLKKTSTEAMKEFTK
ncbi:hypothetical protein EXS74_01295 [Candidatus Woesearchaeota archaeon]|nr:hypothetical protein [Candidatus Woesearchaeota archaeon]